MDVRSDFLHTVSTGVLVGNFAGQSERKEQSQNTQNRRKVSEFFHMIHSFLFSIPRRSLNSMGFLVLYYIILQISSFLLMNYKITYSQLFLIGKYPE